MNNLGGDTQAWLWLAELFMCIMLSAGLVFYVYISYKKQHKLWVRIVITFLLTSLIIILLAGLFLFFGAGKPLRVTPVVPNGQRGITVNNPELSTVIPPAKKDVYLQQVDDSAEADRKAANTYIKDALERSKTR